MIRRLGALRAGLARRTTLRRTVKGAFAWIVIVVLLELLDLRPSLPLLAALTLAIVAGALAIDTDALGTREVWVAGDLAGTGLQRGADHRTSALAEHLARVHESPDTAGELADRVHGRLQHILEGIVWRTQGVDLRANAQWAHRLLPDDLAALYTGPPDPHLLRPDRLAATLTRIEQL